MRAGPESPQADPRPSTRRAVRAWLLVAGWVGIVLWLGSSSFGAASTERFLFPLLRWLLPGVTATQLFRFADAIRQLAHPTVYAALALLSLRAWWLTLRNGLARAGLFACALALLVAAVDESRQHFLPERTGDVRDVAWDGAGAAAAVGAALAVLRRRREDSR